MSEVEQPVLVCALADSPMVVQGTVFGHRCIRCGREVMMAPSGQQLLTNVKNAVVWCALCYYANAKDKFSVSLAGPPEVIAKEAATSMPNPRHGKKVD